MSSAAHLIPELQPVGWLGVVVSLCIVLAYLFKAIRAVARFMSQGFDFFADWRGEQARPGFDARPGIPERIARLEAAAELTRAQLHTNGGQSLRDQTDRIEKTLNDHIIASGPGQH